MGSASSGTKLKHLILGLLYPISQRLVNITSHVNSSQSICLYFEQNLRLLLVVKFRAKLDYGTVVSDKERIVKIGLIKWYLKYDTLTFFELQVSFVTKGVNCFLSDSHHILGVLLLVIDISHPSFIFYC